MADSDGFEEGKQGSSIASSEYEGSLVQWLYVMTSSSHIIFSTLTAGTPLRASANGKFLKT